jgi:hypothetical protein
MEKTLGALSGFKPPQKKGFRKGEPMLEQGARMLSEEEARWAFHSVSRRNGEALFQRFQEAKEMLSALYDGHLNLVRTQHCGTRFAARLEFLTSHRSLDEDLDSVVRSAGFSLTLSTMPISGLPERDGYEAIPGRFIEQTLELPPGTGGTSGLWLRREPVRVPRTERRYVITESVHLSSDLRKAADLAQAILALAGRLRPANAPEEPQIENKAEVIPISSARSSRKLESDEPPTPLAGAKAS